MFNGYGSGTNFSISDYAPVDPLSVPGFGAPQPQPQNVSQQNVQQQQNASRPTSQPVTAPPANRSQPNAGRPVVPQEPGRRHLSTEEYRRDIARAPVYVPTPIPGPSNTAGSSASQPSQPAPAAPSQPSQQVPRHGNNRNAPPPTVPWAIGGKPRICEFIKNLLKDSTKSNVISWENEKEGEFRINDIVAVAKMWGDATKNDKMDKSKLLRAFGHNKQIFKPGLDKSLFKFGSEQSNSGQSISSGVPPNHHRPSQQPAPVQNGPIHVTSQANMPPPPQPNMPPQVNAPPRMMGPPQPIQHDPALEIIQHRPVLIGVFRLGHPRYNSHVYVNNELVAMQVFMELLQTNKIPPLSPEAMLFIRIRLPPTHQAYISPQAYIQQSVVQRMQIGLPNQLDPRQQMNARVPHYHHPPGNGIQQHGVPVQMHMHPQRLPLPPQQNMPPGVHHNVHARGPPQGSPQFAQPPPPQPQMIPPGTTPEQIRAYQERMRHPQMNQQQQQQMQYQFVLQWHMQQNMFQQAAKQVPLVTLEDDEPAVNLRVKREIPDREKSPQAVPNAPSTSSAASSSINPTVPARSIKQEAASDANNADVQPIPTRVEKALLQRVSALEQIHEQAAIQREREELRRREEEVRRQEEEMKRKEEEREALRKQWEALNEEKRRVALEKERVEKEKRELEEKKAAERVKNEELEQNSTVQEQQVSTSLTSGRNSPPGSLSDGSDIFTLKRKKQVMEDSGDEVLSKKKKE